jgi:hypothetical protein
MKIDRRIGEIWRLASRRKIVTVSAALPFMIAVTTAALFMRCHQFSQLLALLLR